MKMKILYKERLEGSKKDEKLKIIQFKKKDIENPVYFDNLEDLLTEISKEDLHVWW